jgi:Mrp family chromosome partitioning ATPase/capsular polysaccharide biosynthesis protein
MADDQPRYTSLRDYARLLRKQWVLVVVPMVVAGVAALAYTLHATATYSTRAQVLIQDESRQLALLGTPVLSSSAGILAETANTPGLAVAVRRRLHAHVPIATLMGDVSLSIDASTGLLDVNATAPTARFAATVANGYAHRIAATTTAAAQRQFASAARVLRRRLSQLSASATANAGERATLQDEISRVEFLQATSTPAQLVSAAVRPSSPASPKPARDVGLGLLAGLLIGVIAAFVRESFDRRIRASGQIAGEVGLPVVGHVRRATLGRAVRPWQTGDREAAGDVETFRILRSNLDLLLAGHDAGPVLVTSPLPEEGKSTVAASLALASAAAGRRTLLIEADLRRPSLAKRLGIGATPGLADYLSGRAESQAVKRPVPMARGIAATVAAANGNGNGNGNGHHDGDADHAAVNGAVAPGLVCIPAGHVRSGAAELLASSRMRELLDDATAAYELVILDTPPLLPVSDTLGLLPGAGAVILCVRSGQTTREQIQAASDALGRVRPAVSGLVVTGVRASDDAGGQGLYPYRYSYAGRAD